MPLSARGGCRGGLRGPCPTAPGQKINGEQERLQQPHLCPPEVGNLCPSRPGRRYSGWHGLLQRGLVLRKLEGRSRTGPGQGASSPAPISECCKKKILFQEKAAPPGRDASPGRQLAPAAASAAAPELLWAAEPRSSSRVQQPRHRPGHRLCQCCLNSPLISPWKKQAGLARWAAGLRAATRGYPLFICMP